MGMYNHLHHDFAKRTKANLEYIDAAYESGNPDVYNVTQLINSLLGMVIFLKEGKFVPGAPIETICEDVHFEVLIDKNECCKNMKKFLRCFRNAIAHCNIEDFGKKENIEGFILYNHNPKNGVDWKIRIQISEIRKIAFGLVDHVVRNSPERKAA